MDEARLIFPFSLKEREIEMKKRVYTLYRVSTKGQVEKDDIPMQKEACRNFAESQGWEIVKEFSEKGVSGFKKSAKERDELQKIQQAAMEGKFDILLVFMFDRLGRRDDETPFIVEWFTKQGIEVWSVNEGQQRFDTHVDKLMNYIRYWQASGESLKTSVRTRTRLEQLTGEGHYTGGTVAFGYKRVRLGRVNKKNQEVCDLVIDEAEAEIVRLIFHKYVYEGYGAQKLSHYLYEQGVVGRNNKNIPNTSIVRMIKNKGYTGYLINGAVETECPQLRIIEPELFEQAQELRHYNIAHSYINIKRHTHIFYLSNNLCTDTVIFSLRRNLFKAFCSHFYIIVTSRRVDDFTNQLFYIIYCIRVSTEQEIDINCCSTFKIS